MFRMRAEDFGVIQHKGGISPGLAHHLRRYGAVLYAAPKNSSTSTATWAPRPPSPADTAALSIPPSRFTPSKYPYPALPNEPRMQSIEDDVRKLGIHTFPIPLGLKRNEADPLASKCVRCDTCDGYPCLVHAKSDADINCIRQIMHLPNVTLMTNSRVTRLLTNATGRRSPRSRSSTPVREMTRRRIIRRLPRTVTPRPIRPVSSAVCAGAINSAVILLASANDKHPTGLANRSDQVGRNFMYHQADALLAISTERNEDSYTKTWGTNDFYLKDSDPAYPFPLGQVQPVGSFHHEMMKGDAPPLDSRLCAGNDEAPRRSVVAHDGGSSRPGQSGHDAQHHAA